MPAPFAACRYAEQTVNLGPPGRLLMDRMEGEERSRGTRADQRSVYSLVRFSGPGKVSELPESVALALIARRASSAWQADCQSAAG